jgi:hypothetical protein
MEFKTCKNGLHKYPSELRQCPECQSINKRKWYSSNKETLYENNKKRRLADPEAHRANGRKWRAANPEKVSAKSKKWRLENPESAKNWVLANKEASSMARKEWRLANLNIVRGGQLKKYWPNATSQEAYDNYLDMMNAQAGRCAVCDIHQNELKKALCVDHDHNTGRVRGLLCHSCNKAERPIEILKSLIKYLER